MNLSWRRRSKASRRGRKEKKLAAGKESGESELVIPGHFQCPITLDLMKDPVTLSTGITYDRESIETWLKSGHQTCPVSNRALASLEPIPNHTIRRMIQNWCVEHRSSGIDRIPTPRNPVTDTEISQILTRIAVETDRRDWARCRDLVARIKALEKESERNKQCIVANGAAGVLASSFVAFSSNVGKNVAVLEEILSALLGLFPLDRDAVSVLASAPSLRCITWFLVSEQDLPQRRNAVLVLKELLFSPHITEERAVSLSSTEGAFQGLLELIKSPVCSTTTKASLTILFQLISLSSSPNLSATEITVSKLAGLGLIPALLELLAGSERGVCEKSLGVLDAACDARAGRDEAYRHALAVPILVKKMLRVSEAATEFAVSALWKLAKSESAEGGGERVLEEALEVSGFHKLLLVLQVGCGEGTKEKATELLKLLNLRRERLLECVNSVDFKYIRRSL